MPQRAANLRVFKTDAADWLMEINRGSTMKDERTFTRRAALQGMAGAAAAAMLPISGTADRAQKTSTPWPTDAFANSHRMQPFNDEW